MSDREVPTGVTTVDARGIVRVEPDRAAARTVLNGGRMATPEDVAAVDEIRSHSRFGPATGQADQRGVVQKLLEDTYGPYWRESASVLSAGVSDELLKRLAYATGGDERLEALRAWEKRTGEGLPAYAGKAAGVVGQLAAFELAGPLAASVRGAEAGGEAALAARGGSGLARATAGAERMAVAGSERAASPAWYPGMPGTAAFRSTVGPVAEAEAASIAAESAATGAAAKMDAAAGALNDMRLAGVASDVANIERTAPTVERVLASGAVQDAVAEATGAKVASALEKAAAAGEEAAKAKSLRWLPNASELAFGAAQGAGDQIRNVIRDDVYGGKPFTYEDVAAAGLMGAAFGVGGTVAGTLAAKGIGRALSKMGDGYGEKVAARELLDLGMTKGQHAEITRKFGSLEAYVTELEKGGLHLSKVPAGKLGEAVDITLAKAGEVRQQALSASLGARDKINPERLYRLVQDAIAHESALTAVGAGHAQNQEIRSLLKELGEMTDAGQFVPGSAFKGKDVIRKLDAIQSRFGQLERGAMRGTSESGAIAGGFYGKVKRTIKSEMERAISESSPQVWQQYQAANKAYSAAKTMAKFVDKEALAAARAGAAPPGSGIGKAALGAVASTVLFGKPYNLLYGEGGKFMVKQIAGGLSALERGLVGMGAAIGASAAARESFTAALGAIGAKSASVAASAAADWNRPVSPNMTKYLSPKEFIALRDKIVSGQPVTAFGDEDSPVSAQEKAVLGRLRDGVMRRMQQPDAYVIDQKLWAGQPAKLEMTTTDLKVLRYIDGAFNPLGVPGKVVAGTAGPEHVEALTELYPSLKAEMDKSIADVMTSNAELTKRMSVALTDPAVRASLSAFIGAPLSSANDPAFAAKLRAIREEEAKAAEESKKSGGGGGGGPPAGSGANYMTESERIEK